MIKRLLGIKRYYIVFYTFSVNGKDWGTGYISINNTLGKFFNNKWVVEEVKKDLQSKDIVTTKDSDIRVAITGWKELSKNDFDDFNNTKD